MPTLLTKLPTYEEYTKDYLDAVRLNSMFVDLVNHQISIRTAETEKLMKKGGIKNFEKFCIEKYSRALEIWVKLEKEGVMYEEIENFIMNEIITPERDFENPELAGALDPEDMIILQDYLELISDMDNF